MAKHRGRAGAGILFGAVLVVSVSACATLGSVGAGGSGLQDAPPTPAAAAGPSETPFIPPEPTIDPHPAKPTGGSISNGLPPTAAQIENWIREDTSEYTRLDRVIQKTTTFDQISAFTGGISYSYAPTDLVVFATGVGVYIPQMGRGSTYTWGTTVFDATTGQVVGSFAAPGDPPAVVLPE